MNNLFYRESQPLRIIGPSYTAPINAFASMFYFVLGAWVNEYDSYPGVILSLMGGGLSGLLFGVIGSGIEQNNEDSFHVRLHKRLLLEFLIQLSGLLSIPFGCMITFTIDLEKIEQMIIRYMMGHAIIVGTKFLILLSLLKTRPIAENPELYHTHCMLFYFFNHTPVPRVIPEVIPEVVVEIIEEPVFEAEAYVIEEPSTEIMVRRQ
jgi:hypothetical protein